jgi:LAO/AO transport system kinase
MGVAEVWDRMEAFKKHIQTNGWMAENRRQQARFWLEDTLEAGIKDLFYQHPEVKARLEALEPEVLSGRVSAIDAAMQVLAAFRKGV